VGVTNKKFHFNPAFLGFLLTGYQKQFTINPGLPKMNMIAVNPVE